MFSEAGTDYSEVKR